MQRLLANILILSVVAPRVAFGAETKLELKTAKDFAIQHNFSVLAQQKAIEEATNKRKKARARFLPEIGIEGGSEAKISGTNKTGGGFSYGYLNYNLFRGFQDLNLSEQAEHEEVASTIDLELKKFHIGLAVEQVFHTYIYKATLIELKEEETKINEKHLKFVQQSRAMGSVSDADVMVFRLKDSLLKSQLVSLKQELDDTRSELKRLLGEKIGEKIQPVGTLQHMHVTDDLGKILKRVQEESTQVRETLQKVKVAQAEESISKGKWLPEVDLEVQTGILREEDRIEGKGIQSSVLLIGRWPLFSGGDAYWESQEKRAAREKVEYQLKDIINQVVRESEIGFRTLKTIESRSDVEKDNATFAARYYKSVLSEYQRGVKSAADLDNAADKQSEANRRRAELDFEFIQRKLALEQTLGFEVSTEVLTHDSK